MLVTKFAEYVWSDKQSRYIPVRKMSEKWTGSVALCKGASAAQNNLANSQASFYNTLQGDYGQQFAAQSNILSSLNNTLNPIIAAGPSQFGFSQGETNTLNSTAIQGTGQQYANASQALKQNQAAQGGGNSLLPSGVQSQQQQQLASSAANQTSNQLLGIQSAGYAQGNQNFNNAVGAEQGVAGLYNPAGYAGQATGAGSSAFNSATTVNNANNAASPWGILGGVLGGAAGAFGSSLTGGLSSLFSGGSLASASQPTGLGTQDPSLGLGYIGE